MNKFRLPFPPCIINATASRSIPGNKSPVDDDGCFNEGGICLAFSFLLADSFSVLGACMPGNKVMYPESDIRIWGEN